MADNLTTATIDVRANTRGMEKDILKALKTVEFSEINTKKSSQALGRITGQVSEFNKSLEASNARVVAFGASAGAIFAVEKAFSSLISSTVEVQKKLTDVNILLGLSSSGLQKFGASLFDIAKNTAQSFSTVADAATELSRQGLGVEETLKRTNAALVLTRLSGLDAKSSVDALTATLNSFAGSALDAVEVVNKLANVDAAFAVSSADLANAISRVGSTAVDAGVSLDELIALVTSAQQTTARGGAVIGNSFKTIFTRLQRGKVQDLLGSLGVDTTEGQSAISLLQQLAATYDTLGATQKSYVAEQVGGVFQINILKAALSDLGKEYSIFGRALDTSLSSTDEAIRRNELLNQTISALSSQAVSGLQEAASKIGSIVFEPNAKGFLSGFNNLLDSFNNIDAESAGGKLMTGFFKGVGDFISGPGAVLATAVLVKLFATLAKFAAGSAKELLGTNKAAQQQAAIEQSILSILQKNNQFTNQILSGKITTVQAEKQMLDYLTAQSNILREQERLSKVIGANLSKVGVSVGASGVPMVAAAKGKKAASSGFIPNFASDQAIGQAMENSGARQHGYKAGKAKKTTIHDGNGKSFKSFVNSKEDVKTFTNSAGKKATVVRPPNGFGENTQYAAGGFVPNFAEKRIASVFKSGSSLRGLYDTGPVFDMYNDSAILKYESLPKKYEEYRKEGKFIFEEARKVYTDSGNDIGKANSYISKRIPGGFSKKLSKEYFDKPFSENAINPIVGALGEKDFFSNNPEFSKLEDYVGPDFKKGDLFAEVKILRKKISEKKLLEKALRGAAYSSPKKTFKNENRDVVSPNLIFASAIKESMSSGFIPNFASAKASDRMTQMVMDKFYAINDPVQFKKEYDIQSFKPAALKALYRERVGGGDSTLAGRAGFANQKATSGGNVPVKDLGKLEDYTMIHAGAEGYSKKIADYTKEDKKTGQKTRYLASIGTAGLNGKQLRGGSIQDRVGDALVTEANNLSETFNPGGGSKFSNYKQLANTGSVFSAAGTVFESAVRGAFNVPAQGQGDRIDFPNPSERLRSFFHGATGSYEAKITDTPQNRSSSLSKYIAVKGLSSGFVPNFAKEVSQRTGSDALLDNDGTLKINYLSSSRGNPMRDLLRLFTSGAIKKIEAGMIVGPNVPKLLLDSSKLIENIRRKNPLLPRVPITGSFRPSTLKERINRNSVGSSAYKALMYPRLGIDYYTEKHVKDLDKTMRSFGLDPEKDNDQFVNLESLFPNGIASGFVPNFAKSKLSFSHTKEDEFGISSLNAIMGGKKVGGFETSTRKDGTIDIGDISVNKAYRGRGISGELYKEAIKRSVGKKMKGQLLPQMNRLLEKIKKGEPVSAETLYPQIKRADLAKSSVFEVYGHKGLEAEKMTRDQFTSFVNAKISELKKDPKKLQSYFGNIEAGEYGGLGVDLQTQHSSGFVPNFASGIITGDVIRGNEYKSVLDFLAKTNKPVRTIIGPSGSGKTTMASKSGGSIVKSFNDLAGFDSYILDRATMSMPKDEIVSENLKKIFRKSGESGALDLLVGSRNTIKSLREKRAKEGDSIIPDRKQFTSGSGGVSSFVKGAREFVSEYPGASVSRIFKDKSEYKTKKILSGGFVPNFASPKLIEAINKRIKNPNVAQKLKEGAGLNDSAYMKAASKLGIDVAGLEAFLPQMGFPLRGKDKVLNLSKAIGFGFGRSFAIDALKMGDWNYVKPQFQSAGFTKDDFDKLSKYVKTPKGESALKWWRSPVSKASGFVPSFADQVRKNMYDWDGTIIPTIRGGADEYIRQLGSLKEKDLLPIGKKLKAGKKKFDILTSRPPMFEKAISETSSRLGLPVNKINFGVKPKDKIAEAGRRGSKIVDDNLDLIGKPGFLNARVVNKRLSSGFVPNFSGALNDAIGRERAAGLSESQIYVDKHSSLKNKNNPMGLMVANTRDEPAGGFQGIARARKEGVNPKTYGLSRGFVPNFASPVNQAQKITIPQIAKGLGRALVKVLLDQYLGDGVLDSLEASGLKNLKLADAKLFAEELRYKPVKGKHRRAFEKAMASDVEMQRQFPQYNTKLSTRNSSSGFVPNFSSALDDAIAREQSSGLSKSQIYVDKHSSLKNKNNPMGLMVANTRDEPLGGIQGIKRAKKEGRNPKTYGGASSGFVPNFFGPNAEEKLEIDSLQKSLDELENQIKQAASNFSNPEKKAERLERRKERLEGVGYGDVSTSETKALESKAGKARELRDRLAQKGDVSGAQRAQVLVQAAESDLKKLNSELYKKVKERIKSIENEIAASKPSVDAYKAEQAALSENVEATRGRLESKKKETSFTGKSKKFFKENALGAGFGLQAVAGMVGEYAGNDDTKEGRGAKAIASGIGTVASFAGTGAMFGPWGAAIGAGVGVIKAFHDGIKAVTSKVPDMEKSLQTSSDAMSRFGESGQKLLQLNEQYGDALNSGNPGQAADIMVKTQKAYAEELSKLTQAQRDSFISAVAQGKGQEEYAKILGEMQDSVRASESALSLQKFSESKGAFGGPDKKLISGIDKTLVSDLTKGLDADAIKKALENASPVLADKGAGTENQAIALMRSLAQSESLTVDQKANFEKVIESFASAAAQTDLGAVSEAFVEGIQLKPKSFEDAQKSQEAWKKSQEINNAKIKEEIAIREKANASLLQLQSETEAIYGSFNDSLERFISSVETAAKMRAASGEFKQEFYSEGGAPNAAESQKEKNIVQASKDNLTVDVYKSQLEASNVFNSAVNDLVGSLDVDIAKLGVGGQVSDQENQLLGVQSSIQKALLPIQGMILKGDYEGARQKTSEALSGLKPEEVSAVGVDAITKVGQQLDQTLQDSSKKLDQIKQNSQKDLAIQAQQLVFQRAMSKLRQAQGFGGTDIKGLITDNGGESFQQAISSLKDLKTLGYNQKNLQQGYVKGGGAETYGIKGKKPSGAMVGKLADFYSAASKVTGGAPVLSTKSKDFGVLKQKASEKIRENMDAIKRESGGVIDPTVVSRMEKSLATLGGADTVSQLKIIKELGVADVGGKQIMDEALKTYSGGQFANLSPELKKAFESTTDEGAAATLLLVGGQDKQTQSLNEGFNFLSGIGGQTNDLLSQQPDAIAAAIGAVLEKGRAASEAQKVNREAASLDKQFSDSQAKLKEANKSAVSAQAQVDSTVESLGGNANNLPIEDFIKSMEVSKEDKDKAAAITSIDKKKYIEENSNRKGAPGELERERIGIGTPEELGKKYDEAVALQEKVKKVDALKAASQQASSKKSEAVGVSNEIKEINKKYDALAPDIQAKNDAAKKASEVATQSRNLVLDKKPLQDSMNYYANDKKARETALAQSLATENLKKTKQQKQTLDRSSGRETTISPYSGKGDTYENIAVTKAGGANQSAFQDLLSQMVVPSFDKFKDVYASLGEEGGAKGAYERTRNEMIGPALSSKTPITESASQSQQMVSAIKEGVKQASASTVGGAITSEENKSLMSKHGYVQGEGWKNESGKAAYSEELKMLKEQKQAQQQLSSQTGANNLQKNAEQEQAKKQESEKAKAQSAQQDPTQLISSILTTVQQISTDLQKKASGTTEQQPAQSGSAGGVSVSAPVSFSVNSTAGEGKDTASAIAEQIKVGLSSFLSSPEFIGKVTSIADQAARNKKPPKTVAK